MFVYEGKEGIVAECTSMDTEIHINSVMVTKDIDGQLKSHRFQRILENYAGPEFVTLDERIQNSLLDYLAGFGLNEHLAAFVECMSLDKDQRLYMNWLGDLKNFINH